MKWQTDDDTKGYIFQFQNKKGPIWLIRDGNGFYAHYINHSDTRNCEVDNNGVVTAMYYIKQCIELTMDYGTREGNLARNSGILFFFSKLLFFLK